MADPMTVDECDPNDWPLVAWAFIAMARGGTVSIAQAARHIKRPEHDRQLGLWEAGT